MTDKNSTYHPPIIGEEQIALLERLCLASGVSGDEAEVRKIVLEELKPVIEARQGEIKVDALGNVLVNISGADPGPRLRVMLDAHMDEVGFMITHDEDKGIFNFALVGGIDIRQLPGKAVWIGREHIPGVIGAKPKHLTRFEELRTPISLETLRIDVGLGPNKVQVGDRAVFATQFKRLGPSLCARALDNRFGVATLIELVKHAPANIDLLAAFAVQEEIGGRGARVAAYHFDPQMAIAIDSTPAYDLPTWDESENGVYNTHLDAGPAIYLGDSGTLGDPRLARHMMQTGEKFAIPYQVRQAGGGGTDAAAIHKQRAGIPSLSVSVPSRYQHTAASMGRLDDWQNTLSLLHASLSTLPADLLAEPR